MDKILITGGLGQLGTELVSVLQNKFGTKNVIITDIHPPLNKHVQGEIITLDILDSTSLIDIIKKHKITQIYHLAAILSARAEENPGQAWKVNMDGLLNVLEIAKEQNIKKVFWPSSIAVFGPDAPKNNTPQHTVLNPNTIYGITKVAGEQLCAYYNMKFGLDVRSLRYPGLIGYNALPGGGTTDYAVEIFYEALKNKKYTSFLDKGTYLPMMYMPDCIKCTIDLIEAPVEKLVHKSYNITAMSFAPEEIAAEIKKHIPEFEMSYKPDFRQQIAESWPKSLDDSTAQKEWGWKPDYDLAAMVKDMLDKLSKKLGVKY